MSYNTVTGWKREPVRIAHKVRPLVAAIFGSFILVFGLGFMQKRDAEAVREYERIAEYDLSRCTPPGARVTPLVEFSIESRSDGRALIKGCTRYQDRSLIPAETVLQRR